MTTTRRILLAAVAAFFVGSGSVAAQKANAGGGGGGGWGADSHPPPKDWDEAKNIADDIIYKGVNATFYCGCTYRSKGNERGSGSITDDGKCGYEKPDKQVGRADRIEWEHVVPKSLTPNSKDPKIIYDLHNLVPTIGQVNALRSNDRYQDLPDETSDFGACRIEDENGTFEPPDCKKGDVARIWLYMRDQHGVKLQDGEEEMFMEWSDDDPVSPWESERGRRIFEYMSRPNPYVNGVTPDPGGACSWEPELTAQDGSEPLALYDDNGNGRITCAEARAHGIAPVSRGHPAYEYMQDRDGDGTVCE